MGFDRRTFVGSVPLMALGFEGLIETLRAEKAITPADEHALNFWIDVIGIPEGSITSAGTAYRKGHKTAGGETSINREPIFLHWDEDQKTLIPVGEIAKTKLLPDGDAQVDVTMDRLRLNSEDEGHFASFASGGIYMDMQQHPELAASGGSDFTKMASSVFSAFFPKSGGKTGGSGNKKRASVGNGFLANPTTPASGAAGHPVPLQQQSQAQSLVLPKGAGKAMFVAFVKDRRQSVFGQFISAVAGSNTSSYSQLLSIPFLASPALGAIRAIVANLQLSGGNQAVVMQSAPLNIAATQSVLADLQNAIPMRTGSYIALPQEHGSAIKDQMGKLKIVKGYLVDKSIDPMDLNDDLVAAQVPGVSYLTLGVTAKKSEKGSCGVTPRPS